MKRPIRLNGWHRIGITASVLWLLVGAFWGYKAGDLEGDRTVSYWRSDCIAHNGVIAWDRDGNPIDGPRQASGGPAASPQPSRPALIDPYVSQQAPHGAAASPTAPAAPSEGPWVKYRQPTPDHTEAQKPDYTKYIDPVTGERLTVSDWCVQQSDKLWPSLNRYTWAYSAIYALVPIPLSWLTALGIIALVRWISAGFRPPTSPS